MPKIYFKIIARLFLLYVISFLLCSCSSYHTPSIDSDQTSTAIDQIKPSASSIQAFFTYAPRLPSRLDTHGGKIFLIDPNVHAWGAYDESGTLIRAGLASAGSDWCFDIGRRCHTKPGSFRVYSLGGPECKSSLFPIPNGGAPMPYCMFFNNNQALHGVHEGEVVEGNVSHGCVRLHIPDAEWLRYNFIEIGTKVIVYPY